MAKWAADAVLDEPLDLISTATEYYLCSSQPADRAAAIAAALADTTLAGGDFTKSNGTTSGRRVDIAEKLALDVDATGTANHLALSTASTLLYVTTCPGQALTMGNKVDIAEWGIEFRDPS